ncbi:hypothetical protein [Kribbella sp. NBC_00889]|uniref:hypothetical protein n=1 Tax=Kribbella sp. NBC_00889 TaxID=2975974 RepID=UPI00386CD27E|nr:hypothetical protein OG817_22140 [Kribbella sp. NBC_00889]
MITFTLTPDYGDSLVVEADSRDIFVWEKTNKGKSLGQLKDNLLMGDMYPIAHIAAKRLGEDVPGKLDDFVQAYKLDWDEDEAEAETAADPTQPAASAES